MLCMCSHLLWHVVQLDGGHKVADPAGRSAWCAGWRLVAGVKHDEDFWQGLALDDNTLDASQRTLEVGQDGCVIEILYYFTNSWGTSDLLSRFYHVYLMV